MIGYSVIEQDLLDAIHRHDANWRTRVAAKTAACRAARKFVGDSDWSSVKPAYMTLQYGKCCFCEKDMGDEPIAAAGQDVEHFRPKGRVLDWLTPDIRKDLGLKPTEALRQKSTKGYFLLAYHHFNYASSCPSCNQSLKRDFFPIMGSRSTAGNDPAALVSEKPLLIYPIGDFDEKPETLICFEGVLATPSAGASGRYRRLRARATILFFRLNRGKGREELVRQRAMAIDHLFMSMRALDDKDAVVAAAAKDRLRQLTAADRAHSNCTRSFLALWLRDKSAAFKVWKDCSLYIRSRARK